MECPKCESTTFYQVITDGYELVRWDDEQNKLYLVETVVEDTSGTVRCNFCQTDVTELADAIQEKQGGLY